MKCFYYLMIVILTNSVLAQDITNKLGASGNYDVTDSSDNLLFRVQADKGAIFYGTWGSGTIPQEGDGVRMMWYPNKAAFRAGSIVSGNQWDETNIGQNSVAMGRNTQASGWYSTALGNGTVASGTYSTALGASTLATNNAATAMGANSESSGFYSLAAGYGTKATGTAALAVGWHTIANANNSTALGNYVSIDGYEGSFIIGDNSTTDTTEVTTSNQMVARFASGYTFYTNSSGTLGATLPANGGSWAAPSDSTKKENFQQADGEYFLNSIKELKLGSWNYKAQDSSVRHYGPMAQEIFHYFGKDDFGTIGNDTTLATADMDGIMMVAIQALENRTRALQDENQELKKEITGLKNIIGEILMIKD